MTCDGRVREMLIIRVALLNRIEYVGGTITSTITTGNSTSFSEA